MAMAIGNGEIADRAITDREMDGRRLADRAMGSPELGPVSSAISLAAFCGDCLRDCLATGCIHQGWLVLAVPPSGNRAVAQAVPEGNP
jgi:hypothetical protein